MNRRDLLVGAAGVLPLVSHAQTSSLRERVLGAWRIIDAETVNVATGATQPWLGRPRPYTGIIVYLPNGFMSVQIGAARPPSRVGADFGVLSMEEKAGYADTWYAISAASRLTKIDRRCATSSRDLCSHSRLAEHLFAPCSSITES
jgi:Lipocalin-like domain